MSTDEFQSNLRLCPTCHRQRDDCFDNGGCGKFPVTEEDKKERIENKAKGLDINSREVSITLNENKEDMPYLWATLQLVSHRGLGKNSSGPKKGKHRHKPDVHIISLSRKEAEDIQDKLKEKLGRRF